MGIIIKPIVISDKENIFKQTMEDESTNEWENVVKFIDVHGEQHKQEASRRKKRKSKKDVKDDEDEIKDVPPPKDVSRMKKLLIQLKNEKPKKIEGKV